MFEYIDNILCVSASWLYGEGEIMSKNNYDKLVQRKNLKKLNTGGNGRTAWVAFNSLPERFKDKITSQCDPYERTKHILFEDYITPDHYAEAFFATYTVEGDEGEQTSIPEDRRKEYTHNAMILSACYFIATNVVVRKKFGNKQVWDNMASVIAQLPRHTYKHKLPTNPRDLKAKALAFKGVKTSKRYPVAGYEGLIHSGYLNKTAAKLTGVAAEWTLARWCNQVNKCASLTQLHAEYNDKATAEGWKLIKDEKTFYNYLYDEEIQPLWWGHRYGELAYKEKYGFQHKTKLPTMRDSLWYSDGTKLNYYYLDENGNPNTTFDANGVPTIKDIINEDALVRLGTMNPTFNGALSLQLRYKAFELGTMFIYAGGHKLRKDTYSINQESETHRDITQRWTATNPTDMPRMSFDYPATLRRTANTVNTLWQFGDNQVVNADYIKWRNVLFSCYIPKNICEKLRLQEAKITAQLNNLLTWCAAGDDIDPETYHLNSGSRALPVATAAFFGISFSF